MSRTNTTSARAVFSRRAALLSLAVLPVAACASNAEEGQAEDPDADSSGGGGTSATGGISVNDPWVKAAEDGMTAAFGTITNDTDVDLVLVSVATPATEMAQLHETTSDGSGGMSMEEKEGGFPIPAGEELVLEPGGDHIMLMDLPEPLLPGDRMDLTLVFADGTEHPFTATVKDFAGAQENYAPGDSEDAGASDGGGGELDGHDEHGEDE